MAVGGLIIDMRLTVESSDKVDVVVVEGRVSVMCDLL